MRQCTRIWRVHKNTSIRQRTDAHNGFGTNVISEEVVFKIQNEFEDRLQQADLPDAIGGKEIYTYRSLIRPWYNRLAGQHRYHDVMTQKLRRDWIDYIEAVRDRVDYNYLSLESQNEEQADEYRNQHIKASRKA